MSILLRFIRSQGIKSGLTFLRPKENNICNRIHRSDVSVKNSEKESTYEVKKPWVSYGFYKDDQKADSQAMHVTFFISVSVVLVFGALVIGYAPDPFLKDWAQREAYLQLRYREEHGLVPIDPNLIDPSKIKLPSEEELIDVEIII
ncbi:NADH dehydrogenase [ubiquinone] 1 beta subcomplex subunit 11, mitochondrial [Bombus terrestris]|uniref:NADH dehydrogenase [ubiquinone] 1 beta subcomplex subunit 11, mitochondrial n=1 Tax=Bombus terrestris TaxID=30195 RepID=A0A9B2MM73_BOMTE|nr:NADH dehydrogenase [ubiquinone] 1 beta subcomplex subunit 11, mitochondrial [Bombus terrestris]